MGSSVSPKQFLAQPAYGQSPTGVTSQAKAATPVPVGPGSASIYGQQAAAIPEAVQAAQAPLASPVSAMSPLNQGSPLQTARLNPRAALPFYGM